MVEERRDVLERRRRTGGVYIDIGFDEADVAFRSTFSCLIWKIAALGRRADGQPPSNGSPY